MRRLVPGLLTLALCLFPVNLSAEGHAGVQERRGQAWVNWEVGVLKARGFGVPPKDIDSPGQAMALARRAAIVDAYRALLEVSLGVLVRSRTVLEQAQIKWDSVEAQAEGLVRGAEIIEERMHADQRYEVVVQMPLYGRNGLGSLLLPWLVPKRPGQPPTAAPSPDPEAEYTGLVVVVKGMRLDRSMSPAVISRNGEIIYGRGWFRPGSIDPDYVVERGIVGYASSIQKATRAGPRPLVVRAIGVSGPPRSEFKTDVVVSEADAQKIRTANEKGRFLERFAVDIVVEQ